MRPPNRIASSRIPRRWWSLLAALLTLCLSAPLYAQDTDIGHKIYVQCAPSVLLLYAQGSDGGFVAQGSGFVIDGGRIVTNAHVANAGKIFVDLGPARLATSVEKIDAADDLAILRVDVQLTVKPLKLALTKPAPGSVVFAIGNPEGLEKTISQGVVSGQRDVGSQELLQISAPISHGSSGGPIVNSAGEVVGVAAGSFSSGQNLNFAVPVLNLQRLLSGAKATDSTTVAGTLSEIAKLDDDAAKAGFSQEADSPYQAIQNQIKTLVEKAFDEAGTDADALMKVSEAADREGSYDLASQAAERAVQKKPTAATQLRLAEALNEQGLMVGGGGEESKKFYDRAERAARSAVTATHPPTAEALYALGDILENEGSYRDSENLLRQSLSSAINDGDKRTQESDLRDLILCAFYLKNQAEMQHWFDELVNNGFASFFDWYNDGDHLSDLGKFKDSGDAYARGAQAGGFYTYWCSAATSYALANENDLILWAARKCIETGVGKEGSESHLAVAHRQIADILVDRGVYSEALSHAKEATVLDSKAYWAFDDMAQALIGLHRPQEAIVAAQQAIVLSDGKYGMFHFHLGSAYFDVENWESARQSFQKAAEIDSKEPSSAFNVALCNQRLGFLSDAANWYEEYLKRKPDASNRDEILQRIRTLRSR